MTSLPNLPPPSSIQPVNPQAERDLRLSIVTGLMRDSEHGNVPSYTPPLPSDPAYQVLSTSAYRDQLRVQQMNKAVRSNLILFAEGTDLDNLGITPPFNVRRLSGESDNNYRIRIQLRIRGWSPGTLDYYEFYARSASVDIRDIARSVNDDKQIVLTVMSQNGTGYPDNTLLEKVETAVNAPNIKLNNDDLVIQPVELVPVTLIITLFLRPDALPGIKEGLEESFPDVFEKHKGLGWDVARSWIEKRHEVAGVKRVSSNLPENTAVAVNQCAYLASYRVSLGGKEW